MYVVELTSHSHLKENEHVKCLVFYSQPFCLFFWYKNTIGVHGCVLVGPEADARFVDRCSLEWVYDALVVPCDSL